VSTIQKDSGFRIQEPGVRRRKKPDPENSPWKKRHFRKTVRFAHSRDDRSFRSLFASLCLFAANIRGYFLFTLCSLIIPRPYEIPSFVAKISVALKNEPGQLATVCSSASLGTRQYRALSILDNVEQGVIRILTNDSALNARSAYEPRLLCHRSRRARVD